MAHLETDYLVVGAGAVGMAFTDSLVAHCDADVVLVDRRHRPGGHWHDAYPFVRLHVPSAYYGVNSTPLGRDAVDASGPNAGMYELATAAEICDYFGRVLDDVLLPTGRVRFLGMHDFAPTGPGGYRVVPRLGGEPVDVVVRRALVDATYLEGSVPSTHRPSFPVHPDVRFIPVNGLVHLTEPASRYVVLGSGKTSVDACLWLLAQGVEPARIQWVRPRDMWLADRAGWQPLDLVADSMEGLSLDLEALAHATSVDDLFERLERCGRLLRIDPQVVPTMYRCASVSRPELVQLRSVSDVVRLGRVLRLEPDEIVLEQGSVPTSTSAVHVDCTAAGIRRTDPRPVFEPGRVTVQPVRSCLPPFNAALIGYLEATRVDDADKNRLCPPNPYPDAPLDWLQNLAVSMEAARIWNEEPDLVEWLESSRLNLLRGVAAHVQEPTMARALERFAANVKPGLAAVHRLLAEVSAPPPQRGAVTGRATAAVEA